MQHSLCAVVVLCWYVSYRTVDAVSDPTTPGRIRDIACRQFQELGGACRINTYFDHMCHTKSEREVKEFCPAHLGYTFSAVAGICFRVETKVMKSWPAAERDCTNNQGHLIKLDTKSKNDFFRNLLTNVRRGRDVSFSIGARKFRRQNRWKWLDNTYVSSAFWGPREPNGDGQCVSLLEKHQYKWNDESLSRKKYYICEITKNF